MNKFNNLEDSSSRYIASNEENSKANEDQIQKEKVLCNHCGRTARNGIRCLGICVADSDY
tara:strand:+ start:216 stop:395 length:180 start_codon:yes stop_codon:yes gene_type:complete